LKEAETKKKGFEKIPDRIEDMSPLPSPLKNGINGEYGKRRNPFGGSS
jgi:hypothetical protein